MSTIGLAPPPDPPTPSEPSRDPISIGLSAVGDLGEFAGRAIIETTRVGRYFSEVLRQCGILITGSALIIVGMVMVVGSECGLLTVYLLRPIGASGFAGFTTALCGLREMWPYMFGYVFAAKVGCGLVAEVGSMRITEEIDALGVMGINPMRYIVATRLLAVWMTVPFIYALAMVFGTLGSYLVIITLFNAVSLGQWISLHFASQTLTDDLFSLIKVMTFATLIAIVGLYYGYRARNGPVGVGTATARSMVVNLVLIHVLGGALTAIFWGTSPRIVIGG
jgi:phospholipid/cholesterol/gamma-HCH transport system permease protein